MRSLEREVRLCKEVAHWQGKFAVVRNENNQLRKKRSISDVHDREPVGWKVISVGSDGCIYCESPSGDTKRFWVESKPSKERLVVVVDKGKVTTLVVDGSVSMPDVHAEDICGHLVERGLARYADQSEVELFVHRVDL